MSHCVGTQHSTDFNGEHAWVEQGVLEGDRNDFRVETKFNDDHCRLIFNS
jgi:SH3-like domain-containing protein